MSTARRGASAPKKGASSTKNEARENLVKRANGYGTIAHSALGSGDGTKPRNAKIGDATGKKGKD